MVALSRTERGHAILSHFLHYFWLLLAMSVVVGVLLFIVSCRRDLWLRYTAAKIRLWERLGFRSGRFSHALRRFAEGSSYRYILWLLLLANAALALLSAATYLYFKHKFDHVTI
jgi:hypothetical protein